jgi:putative two-component system response regulator
MLRVKNFLKMRQLQSDLQNHNLLLEAKVQQRTELLEKAQREAVDLLATACEFRDDDTGQHTRRVGELSANIATTMGLDQGFVESLRIVAPLHDVGKIAIPDDILHKPGPLTEEERSVMQCHVGIGANLLAERSSPLIQLASEVARYHHERWDGTGYQAGLAGEEIPLCARIVSVADAFDAITSDRPYRKGRSAEEAVAEISKMAGTQFDPAVVKALKQYLASRSLHSTRLAA